MKSFSNKFLISVLLETKEIPVYVLLTWLVNYHVSLHSFYWIIVSKKVIVLHNETPLYIREEDIHTVHTNIDIGTSISVFTSL